MTLNIEYLGFTIKLEQMSEYNEWLVVVRDRENNTVVSNWLSNQKEAETWAKTIIKNIK